MFRYMSKMYTCDHNLAVHKAENEVLLTHDRKKTQTENRIPPKRVEYNMYTYRASTAHTQQQRQQKICFVLNKTKTQTNMHRDQIGSVRPMTHI